MKKPSLKPLALALMLAASPVIHADKTWKINLKDADISALVSEMADITGKNFVVDPRVKGTVSVVSSRALTAGEIYELFQSVLSINGFAAVPAGPVVKILPDTNARQSGVRVDLSGMGTGEQLVTRVITLQQANANELLAALRPMMPQFAHMAAVPAANALIISDRASNADAMEAIIRELDNGQVDDAIEIIPVRNGKAEDLISVLETMETGSATPRDGKPSGKVRIIADERSNRLLVRGDRALRDRVRALVKNLDESPEYSDDTVKVFRLKFANARQVAEVLKGIIANEGDKPVTTTSAAPMANVSGSSTLTPGTTTTAPRAGGTTTITIGSASLIADETQNALIVRASPRQVRQIEAVLADLDRRRAQVLIQAAIVEVSGDNAAQLGVQWAFGDPSTGVGLINFTNAGAGLTSIAAGVLTNDPTKAGIGQGALVGLGTSRTDGSGNRSFYGALVQALNTVTDANLLSTPSILTLDNQEAKIVVGQNVPFITGSTATTGSGVTNPFTTIQRQDVGITLKVTPTLSDGGTVKLDVEQEVSAVVPSTTGINSADLITSKRSIKTSILADDGQTIVLGGLVQDDVKKSVSKVPLLGDIPGVGVLFRSVSDTRVKRNLLVFLQPSILRDAASAARLTQKQYSSVRRIDLGLDAEGRLTRLPPNIQEIYQGGLQRDGRPLTAPEATPAAVAPRPAQQAAPQPAASAPAGETRPAAASLPVAPTRSSGPEAPKVYAAPLPVVIQPQPLAPEPIAETVISPRQTPAPVASPGYRPASSRYVPPRVSADPAARPFAEESAPARQARPYQPDPVPTSPVPAPAARPIEAPATTTTPTGKMRIIRTPSGNVYFVPETPSPSTP